MGGLNEKTILGIDPGKSGAWAAIGEEGELCAYGSFDERLSWDIANADFAMLEKASARPGQGVSSMFAFGMNYGIWQGSLESYGIPFEFVTPQKWQKSILDFLPTKVPRREGEGAAESRKRLAQNRKNLKEAVVRFVVRRYPELREYLEKKKNQDVADAVCIALYGLRRFKGQ